MDNKFISRAAGVLGSYIPINEASEAQLLKQMGSLCSEVSETIKKMVELYDKNENLKELEPEEFFTLIPKQFEGQLAFLGEGFNRASIAWPKAELEDELDEI